MQANHYIRPREKLALLGVTSLSDHELLQLIFGSGLAGVSVSLIARRTVRLLSRKGRDISLDDIRAIPGLGVARASQFLAALELSARYPASLRSTSLHDVHAQYQAIMNSTARYERELNLFILDGSGRCTAHHQMQYAENEWIVRDVSNHILNGHATGIIV